MKECVQRIIKAIVVGGDSVKRLIICILTCMLLSVPFPSAFAEAPEIAAVYAAADTEK